MCGISGFFSSNGPRSLEGYEAAHTRMRHRGPDDEGYVVLADDEMRRYRGKDTIDEYGHLPTLGSVAATSLVMGHRRLSILDLTAAGHQPMCDQSGRYAMVYNGEVFNFRELRAELESAGIAFKTQSDTEVVLQAYIRWGTDAFNRFNGMWALAIWDNTEKSLLLCRDRFGVKPLYFSYQRGAIFFASEMKVIRALPGLELDVNSDAVQDYLNHCLLNHGTGTFWRGISELEPAHWIKWRSNGRTESKAYWSIKPREEDWDFDKALDRFSEIFEDSLRLRMRSDVEVGALLSGGLDSNTIVCALDKLGLVAGGQFKSFSAVFEDKRFCEEHYIRATLEQVPLQPYLVRPDPLKIADDIDRLLECIEEPFRSLSVYSQFKIYERMQADTKVKVVLNGQGADELFSGYGNAFYRLFSQLFWRGWWRQMTREMSLFAGGRKVSFPLLLFRTYREILRSAGQPNYFSEQQFNEVRITPLREYLKYDDRTSMSASVEARTPFLDYRLVEFAFSLPAALKINRFENKVIEREYAKKLVPRAIWERKDKMGFVSPQEAWQQKELAPMLEQAFGELSLFSDWLPVKHSRALYRKYRDGSSNDWWGVWRIFCLMRWLKHSGLPK